MTPPKPRLSVRYDGLIVRTYVLDRTSVTIGRRSDNDIQLDDPAVSGLHARLVLEPNAYLTGCAAVHLHDAGSTNGTLVNGERVIKKQLTDGDIIRLGQHELVYDETDNPMTSTVFLLADA